MQELLKIVEVDKKDRVLCCAPNCNRSVYKKIHIVYDNDEILVLGEKCFGVIYKDLTLKKSVYFGGSSRKLSPEERKLLIENTKALISNFEDEYQLEINHPPAPASAPAPAPAPAPATNYEPKLSIATIVLDGSERYVKCLYCGSQMPTHSKSTPAKGFKCVQCRESRATLVPRKTNKIRW